VDVPLELGLLPQISKTRIVDAWNRPSLHNTVVSAPSINSFKQKLREVNLDRFLTIIVE